MAFPVGMCWSEEDNPLALFLTYHVPQILLNTEGIRSDVEKVELVG